MRVLGVDPGAKGALALYDTELQALAVGDMPSALINGRIQVSEALIADIIRLWEPEAAWIERVHSMPKQGVASSFSFGMSYGIMRGILAMAQIPFELVTPNEWKRHFRLGSDKAEARLVAARMFPANAANFSRIRDEGRAEAALIALFGARSTSQQRV